MTLTRRLSIGIVVLIACVSYAISQDAPGESTRSSPVGAWRPIAVAGIEPADTLDERDRWMPTAVEETLAWRLRRVPGLTVIPTIRIHQSRMELVENANDEPAPWSRVVSLVGADYWLRGVCSGTPYEAKLELELLGAEQPGAAFPTTVIGPGRLFDVIQEATRWALGQLNVARIDQHIEKLILSPPAKSSTALEYYAKALDAARKENLRDAGYYSMRAVESDPGLTPALMLLSKIEMRATGQTWREAEFNLRKIKYIADDRGDLTTAAEFETAQGLITMMSRSFDPALKRLETSLDIGRKIDDPYAQLGAMNSLCDYWLNLPVNTSGAEAARRQEHERNMRHAVEWELRVLDMLKTLDDYVARAPGANKLAMIYEALGESELALEAHKQTIEAAQAIGSSRTQATGCIFLGQWYQRQQRWPEALEAANQALQLVPDPAKPAVRVMLGKIRRGMEKPREALTEYEAAYQELSKGDDMLTQFHCLHAIAELRMELGERDLALSKLVEALDYAQVLELPEEENLREQLARWRSNSP